MNVITARLAVIGILQPESGGWILVPPWGAVQRAVDLPERVLIADEPLYADL